MSTQLLAVPETCDKCGGKLWDNRKSKVNPRAPDFKCRDKACEGVFWPPKKGQAWADMPPEQTPGSVKQPISLGKTGIPDLDEQEGHERRAVAAIQHGAASEVIRLGRGVDTYVAALNHAQRIAVNARITDQQAIVAIAATLYISATRG